MIVQYFLFLFFVPLVTTNAGLFDLAEYRRVAYDATIGEDFLWFAPDLDLREVTPDNIDAFEKRISDKIPDESLPNYVFVTSKAGQRFACSLPEVEGLKKPALVRSSKNPKQYDEILAASFYIDKCITLRERSSWWTYILCRSRTVEQIHGEEKEEGYVRNILGLFNGSFSMPTYQESTEDRLLYVEEYYTSGTFCELNREPRKTAVRYECDSQLSTNEAYISSLVEVVPCQYLMIVKVGSLCVHPEFLPVTLANTKSIGCQPYLTKKDVREMLERQLEEKRKKEEIKKRMNLAREEFQRSIARYNAMSKSQRNLHLPDVIKKTNAEMDYRAAHYNLLISSLEVEGETVDKKKQDYMWKLFSSADIGDYMFHSDYESIEDENRAHLWYYFNDPTWPRDQFPKDILSTAIQNAYSEEVQANLKGKYVFDDADGNLVDGLTQFLKTGKVNLDTNLVISAMEIYQEIKMLIFGDTLYRHSWLNWINLFFIEEPDNTESGFDGSMEEILDSIIAPREDDFYPMGNLAKTALNTLYDDVWYDMYELSVNGTESHILDPEWLYHYEPMYKVLEIVSYPEDEYVEVDGHEFRYNVTALADNRTRIHLNLEYLRILAPTYKLLSIRWFQQQHPKYFHVNPPTRDYLKKTDSDDYKFHLNLARDMAKFAKMLTFSTYLRMKDFERWRDGKKSRPRSAAAIQKLLLSQPMTVHPKAVKLAANVLINEMGPPVVKLARENVWKQKVKDYKTKYRNKDRMLRKQAQSMQGLMKDLLSMKDDSDAFVSLGGKSDSKKKEIFDDKLLEKLSRLSSIDDIDFESIKEKITSIDEDFFDWDDIQGVFDLLEKAGLSKKGDVQIKLFDGDGNEIINEDLAAITKNLFEEQDAANRLKDSERAYLKKVLDQLEKRIEEEDESDL